MLFSWFERLTQPFPSETPTQPPTGLVSFCLFYSRGMWFALCMVACFAASIAGIEVFLFGYLGNMVDALGQSTPTEFFAAHKTNLIFMGVLLLVVLPSCVALQGLFSHQSLLGNFPMRIRWLAHSYLINQSLSFFYNEFAGRIATKVMQTALAVRETVVKLMDILVYVAVYFISIVVLVMTMDIRLGIPFVVWLVAYVSILRLFIPRLKVVSSKQADARSEMTGRIVDTYTNIQTVKLFSHTNQETEYAKQSMGRFLNTVYPQMRLVTVLSVLVWCLNALLIFSVVCLGLLYWEKGIVTAGGIAISVALAMRVNGMSQWIMWEVSGLFENIGMVQDGIDTLALPTDVQDQKNSKPLLVNKGGIEFKGVGFLYKGNKVGQSVFENLNLSIKPGEKIGIVGRSGAGKSTLVNLLLRFYEVNEGKIFIDGQDITSVNQDSLRSNISMVTQDTSLLHRSIRENISYGKDKVTDEDVIAVAKKAEAHDFILNLSDRDGNTGYETLVGERGVKLSGGQRQRVAIARVLLKDAPILILDEATSALDSEVEVAIQDSLYKIMENKTVLAIAHRLSTIAAMDKLIVLDQGKIVEMGTHEELLNLHGQYAKLWAHQTGGFLGLE